MQTLPETDFKTILPITDKKCNLSKLCISVFNTNAGRGLWTVKKYLMQDNLITRALSEITEKCPLLSNQWSFFNSVNDMIFLLSLRMFPEIMKCIILHNECLDDFKDGGPP